MLPIKEGMPGLWSFVESEIEKYFFSLENFELGIRVGSE
jgi:hypothetical protein